jgi:hypothetical protein
MADVVDVRTIYNGRRNKVVRLQNRSDGTGESAVTKIDISTFTTPEGAPCSYIVIDKIEFALEGMSAQLNWDHTTDDEIATLVGQNVMDWTAIGGLVDPRSAGGTGDVLLTTVNHTANDSYDITIHFRCKA